MPFRPRTIRRRQARFFASVLRNAAAAPPAVAPHHVVSVLAFDEENSDWVFDAPALACPHPEQLGVNFIGGTSASIQGGGVVRVNYAGQVNGTGDPWTVALGAWVTFADGGAVAAGTGSQT